MDPLDQEFTSFDALLGVVEILGLAFMIALVSETVWDAVRGQRSNLRDTLANGAIAIVSALLERSVYGLIFILGLVVASDFAVFNLPSRWWTVPAAILAADFTYYWMHRAEHRIRLFWANHSVHHSSEEFNFSTSLRLSWMDALIEWIFFIPMILLGCSVVETIVGLAVVLAYQSWIHTEKVGKLGWLDGVFNTPSAHRVHHGQNPEYIDKNYGGILILWDRLFGTYSPEADTVRYGITTPIETHNPLAINFKEYALLYRDIQRAGSLRAGLGYLVQPPGWHPTPPTEDTSDGRG